MNYLLPIVLATIATLSCSQSSTQDIDAGPDAEATDSGLRLDAELGLLADAERDAPRDGAATPDLVSRYPGCPKEPMDRVPWKNPIEPCTPGLTIWCDGIHFGGWGKVTCGDDERWPTAKAGDAVVLDCRELEDGARPNTDGVCYHFFYKSTSCECKGCVVPADSVARICSKSPGGLCDYCSPHQPECVEDGLCLTNRDNLESYCGRPCDKDTPASCPANYECRRVATSPGKYQCAPVDTSCVD